jgi:pyruvyltransferase
MNKVLYKLHLISASFTGHVHENKIEAYWYIKEKNSGDLVTPMLLKRYGFTPVHSYPGEAKVFSCGSLLEKIPADFSGFILGTGFMHGDSVRSFANARILAVRGEFTRNNIGAPIDTILGDPGLLVSRYLSRRKKKQYTLGIIPHYIDKKDIRIRKICKKYSKEILFIDVQHDPLSVLRKIDQCDFILSSSLHGLVFAACVPSSSIVMETTTNLDHAYRLLRAEVLGVT